MIAWAERDGGARVAVVPVGFHYTRGPRWSIVARIGARCDDATPEQVEAAVRALSRGPGMQNNPLTGVNGL
jgi:hypothetical protein